METAIYRIHTGFLAPTGRTIKLGLRFHVLIWTKYFDQAWDATPLHEKLTWLLFAANTLCVMTILQFLAFR